MSSGGTDAIHDLVLGGRCVGCGRPGRVWCHACALTEPSRAWPVAPSPTPPGLAPTFAAASYGGTARDLVLGHKERRMFALAQPLGRMLAASVLASCPEAACAGAAVLLVPVPSRRANLVARGHDPTHAMTTVAARMLRDLGIEAQVVVLLRLRVGVADQSGLSTAQRWANLHGSMACRTERLRRLALRMPRAHVVVCDDVLTTGASAREAQRALEAVGLPVTAVATVAATPRHSESSGDRLSPSPHTH